MAGQGIDLKKVARMTGFMLLATTGLFFAAGLYFSFWFHFGTVTFLLLTVINFFYRHVQTRRTILRNFGILGQARYILESLGPELRQYLFSSDTEERPFTRVERSEVYRKAKGIDSAISFGSQREFDATEIKLRHSMYPTDKDTIEPFSLTFGEERGCEAAYTIDKHVMISAMSFGSLGKQAVRALSEGGKLAGIAVNTGEGGWPKFHLMGGADLIFQMGTAKFGVRKDDGYLDDDKLRKLAAEPQVKMIEIKLSQGAKPGKGGLLPKEKITPEISELRGVPMGEDVVSPPYHHECKTAADTVQFVKRVQEVSGLPTGLKFCVGNTGQVRELFEAMRDADVFPDYVSIDGGEGGTGAAPRVFLDGVGVPLLPALEAVQGMLVQLGIRDRLKLVAAGKLLTAIRQAHALCLGADACYSARGFMLAIGCIQALECSHNTCPVGITTHDPKLQRGLVIPDKAKRVANYVKGLDKDMYEIVASLGVRSMREFSRAHLYIPSDSILAAGEAN